MRTCLVDGSPFEELCMSDNYPPLFDHLGLFERMNAKATTREYKRKQSIFEQGDKADAVYYIHNGNVKLTVASVTGKKAVVAFLRHGDFFGESCVTKHTLQSCTATTLESCSIASVKRTDLARIVRNDPAFSKLFITYLLYRIARIQHEFIDQIFSSSEKRLARILLELAGFGERKDPEPVLLKVSQATLAEMVGTTRSRVSYFMNRFREKGLIDYNGTLQVHKSLQVFFFHT
jgi:CRP/FNR family transcriptional regulator, cyclic AMP receptor protein